jgi:ArsR family transcriptional regulator
MLNYMSHLAVKQNLRSQTTGLKDLARQLKALGHPSRLAIFDMLMEGVQCNCEIAERLGLSLSLISHHLAVLHKAGLVQSERDDQDARWIYHSVRRPRLAQLDAAMRHLLDADRIQPRQPSCGPRAVKIAER